MVRLTILYPQTADSRFDLAYYLDTHIPLVKERLMPLGLLAVDLQQGLSGATPDAPPTYAMITGLVFDSAEQLGAVMGTHGAELLGDIPNFTDAQPLSQVTRVL